MRSTELVWTDDTTFTVDVFLRRSAANSDYKSLRIN